MSPSLPEIRGSPNGEHHAARGPVLDEVPTIWQDQDPWAYALDGGRHIQEYFGSKRYDCSDNLRDGDSDEPQMG